MSITERLDRYRQFLIADQHLEFYEKTKISRKQGIFGVVIFVMGLGKLSYFFLYYKVYFPSLDSLFVLFFSLLSCFLGGFLVFLYGNQKKSGLILSQYGIRNLEDEIREECPWEEIESVWISNSETLTITTAEKNYLWNGVSETVSLLEALVKENLPKRMDSLVKEKKYECKNQLQVHEISPDFKIHVYYHKVSIQDTRFPCWTYLSEGLQEQGQAELVFTIQCQWGEEKEEYPKDVLKFFEELYHIGKKKTPLSGGDVTIFSHAGLGGSDLFTGVGYVRPQPYQFDFFGEPSSQELFLENIQSYLALIPLTKLEISTVQQAGLTRVLTRLGKKSRIFPHPNWMDRKRESTPSASSKSVLVDLPGLKGLFITYWADTNYVELALSSSIHEKWEKQFSELTEKTPLTIFGNISPQANAALVWFPEQQKVEAITSSEENSILAGCFLTFYPLAEENGGRIVEDGFVFLLTREEWGKTCKAFQNKENYALSSNNEENPIHLRLVWDSYRKA